MPRVERATVRTVRGRDSGTAPATTPSSIACTKPARSWPAPRWRLLRPCSRDGIEHAFNAAGGLHHAMPSRASGFCVYDDPAIAIAWMLGQGVERVAYVDVDVHHGDGVQAIFYDEPRVLTISIHEFAPHLGFFPGTGGPSETGGAAAPGSAINVPLDPGTGDAVWLDAFLRRGAAGRDGLRARRPGDAAGLRHPRERPPGAPSTDHHHLSRDGADPARARARSRRRALGGHGGRRVSVGAGGAARMDDRLRGDGRRRACRRASRGMGRTSAVGVGSPGPIDPVGAADRRKGSCDHAHEAGVHPGSCDEHAGLRPRSRRCRHVDLPHQLLPRRSRGA